MMLSIHKSFSSSDPQFIAKFNEMSNNRRRSPNAPQGQKPLRYSPMQMQPPNMKYDFYGIC